jgi:hypothetical protein
MVMAVTPGSEGGLGFESRTGVGPYRRAKRLFSVTLTGKRSVLSVLVPDGSPVTDSDSISVSDFLVARSRKICRRLRSIHQTRKIMRITAATLASTTPITTPIETLLNLPCPPSPAPVRWETSPVSPGITVYVVAGTGIPFDKEYETNTDCWAPVELELDVRVEPPLPLVLVAPVGFTMEVLPDPSEPPFELEVPAALLPPPATK